jgi:N,N-dimethylformamidase
MASIYRIRPEDREHAEEFRKTPVGHHSLGLQRLLTVFRGEALAGKPFLLCVEPFRRWVLALHPGERGKPFRILRNKVYRDRDEAEWDVFKARWARHTGETLVDETPAARTENLKAGDLPGLKLTAYADRFHVRPGDTVRFMVNCDGPKTFRADIVRLRCGDANPAGPGFMETLVKTPANRRYKGRRQTIHAGSCVRVDEAASLAGLESFTLQVMVWPTTPSKGEQGLIGRWSDAGRSGFALVIDKDGCPALRLGDGRNAPTNVTTKTPLRERQWCLLAASYDAASRTIRIVQKPLAPAPDQKPVIRQRKLPSRQPVHAEGPLLMAALTGSSKQTRAHFNGKLDSPRLYRGALKLAAMAALASGPHALRDPDLVAAWDFSQEMQTTAVIDRSPNRLNGKTVNLPTRAVTGWNWQGEVMDWKTDPGQWGAIHFHDDDLYDAGWQPDVEFTVPDDLKSGIYAARLRAGRYEDYVPFAVGPKPGKEKRIALLLPTATYIAYANEHVGLDYDDTELGCGKLTMLYPQDVFLQQHREYGNSQYDSHSDGSGVCYSSRLRPILNMRPKYEAVYGAYGGSQLWGFNADTHLTDWLDATGADYDVITDEELHEKGLALLAPYEVVMTPSHPEYYSPAMRTALASWLEDGGRLMYLGGNGFYWRIAFSEDCPGAIEVRRTENGIRAWASEPGESYHSFDGGYGGMWRAQGKAPNTLVGVGFSTQGGDISTYFRRRPDSLRPEAAFIFEGIGRDERVGDFGLVGGGAAGLELDRADTALGTPPNTYVLASSENHTDNYFVSLEETLQPGPGRGGQEHPMVRGDMTFFTTGRGGAVFSASSMTWINSLAHANYRNNVSRITRNVLKRFLDPAPFPDACKRGPGR